MKKKSEDTPLELGYLDELIQKYAEKIFKKIENEQVKIGDLLKMIELKRKLSPSDSEQIKLWKMLEKIRLEEVKKSSQKKKSKENKKETK
ncbi:MAG: hypothetical protein DWP97_06120 [Calditrichaeota bacterium]|nr:MAG: hypothetical protein DWP97_06120 [Calditrichota bacterium]